MHLNWPPSYHIVQSKRSKRVYLKMCRRHGLRVVVPRRFNQKEIPALIEKSRLWIEQMWLKIQPVDISLPEELQLLAINQTWNIAYEVADRKNFNTKEIAHRQLKITGDINQQLSVLIVLKKWLKLQAQLYLTARLDELCEMTGLAYTALSIGNANTRWGSCSAKKKISLSLKLLFLPTAVVDYVLLHELCHTVHFNHSKSFWKLLSSFNSNHQELRKALKQYSALTPAWLLK